MDSSRRYPELSISTDYAAVQIRNRNSLPNSEFIDSVMVFFDYFYS